MRELLLDIGKYDNETEIKQEIDNIMQHTDQTKTGTIEFEDFKLAWQRKMLSKQEKYINNLFQSWAKRQNEKQQNKDKKNTNNKPHLTHMLLDI